MGPMKEPGRRLRRLPGVSEAYVIDRAGEELRC